MASEAKTENGADGSGKDDKEANKDKDNSDQAADEGKDNKDEADKGKGEDTSKDAKDSAETTEKPTAETGVGDSGIKSPDPATSRASSATQKPAQAVSNSRPASAVGKKTDTDDEAAKAPETSPSEPPPRGGTPGGRKTAEGEKPLSPAPDTPRHGKNSAPLVSPELASPRSIVSPPLTAMTMDVSRGGPCDICPQMGETKTTKAEFVCHACVQRFCVRCAKRHLDNAVFADHEVDPIASDNQMKALQELSCRVHPKRTLEFFCQGCQEAACGLCISFNHGGKQHQIGRVETLPSNKHVLHSRYEQLLKGELSPSKQPETPDRARPVPFLLWKRESVLQDGGKGQEAAHLCGPSDISFLPGGQLIVADRWNQSVKYFDENGEHAMVVLEKLAPLRVCCTASGRIAVVDDFAQGQIKLIRSEQFINKSQDDSESSTSNNDNMDTADGKSGSADMGTTVDNAHDVEGDQEGHSEQNKDNQESNKENKDTAKVGRNASRQSDRASLGSKQSTRSQGRRSADQDIFRDLSVIINSMDPQDTWKPKGMKRPWAVAVTKYGQWLVSEYEQYVRSSVTIYDSNGSRDKCFGSYGDRDDQFEWPAYLASDSRGRIIVSDYYNHTVKIFDLRGNFICKLGKGWGKKDGHLTFPKGVCVDIDDHILVVDSGNNRVCEFAPDGTFVRNVLTPADGLVEPEGIAFVELPADNQGEEQDQDIGVPARGTPHSQKLEGAQRNPDQRANSQPEGSSGGPQRRLAVTLCKGHEYSALLVYGFEQA